MSHHFAMPHIPRAWLNILQHHTTSTAQAATVSSGHTGSQGCGTCWMRGLGGGAADWSPQLATTTIVPATIAGGRYGRRTAWRVAEQPRIQLSPQEDLVPIEDLAYLQFVIRSERYCRCLWPRFCNLILGRLTFWDLHRVAIPVCLQPPSMLVRHLLFLHYKWERHHAQRLVLVWMQWGCPPLLCCPLPIDCLQWQPYQLYRPRTTCWWFWQSRLWHALQQRIPYQI